MAYVIKYCDKTKNHRPIKIFVKSVCFLLPLAQENKRKYGRQKVAKLRKDKRQKKTVTLTELCSLFPSPRLLIILTKDEWKKN